MKLFLNLLKSSLLLLIPFFMNACSLDEQTDASHAGNTLPWNRPQSWEGAGPLGAAMQGSH
jgi:hypothetical protein